MTLPDNDGITMQYSADRYATMALCLLSRSIHAPSGRGGIDDGRGLPIDLIVTSCGVGLVEI